MSRKEMETMDKVEERVMILKMLQDGKISIDEAEGLLQTLESQDSGNDEQRRTAFTEETKDRAEGRQGFDFTDLGRGLRDVMRDVADGFQQLKHKFPKDVDFGAWVTSVVGKVKQTAVRQLEQDPAGFEGISVKGLWGNIRATAGDAENIKITATITAWGSSEGDARTTAETVDIRLEPENGVLGVSARLPDGYGARRYRVDYDITAPPEFHAALATKSGDVSAGGFRGGVKLSTLSGNIAAAEVTGNVALASKSGDIKVESVRGTATLSTLSGDVEAQDTSGELKGDTKSGDVTIRAHTGNVSARTLSGDVSVAVNLPDEPDVSLQTRNGDVRLQVPDTANATITAKTAQGSIDCRLPLQTTQTGSKLLKGSLGGGGGNIEITTSNGDVTISALEG